MELLQIEVLDDKIKAKEMILNKAWVKVKDRSSIDYVNGVEEFLNFALSKVREDDRDSTTIRCPCNSCRNIFLKTKCDVRFDLLKGGMYEKYTFWELHREELVESSDGDDVDESNDIDSGFTMLQDACGVGAMNVGSAEEALNNVEEYEKPNANAKKFFKLLEEYQEPLTMHDTTMSKLSYSVKLLHLKVLNNWADKSFDSLLHLERQGYGAYLPTSYYEAKKLIKDLGLDYYKIDACENDCILYWKEHEKLIECPTCGLSRWKQEKEGSSKGVKVSRKVLRYFPLKPRLQSLYICRKTSKDMRWHKERDATKTYRVNDCDRIIDDDVLSREEEDDAFLEDDNASAIDDTIRHPSDSFAWKSFDEEYSEFAKEVRNVRLGLACDGFQPFNNSQHSIWRVVLIPYNFPPWLCMKPYSFMLSLLVPGPTSPGINMDVYLQPLIEELKELWEVGVETYDAYSKTNFILRASLLWTINDFPAYADLSGWSTKGYYACPCCHKETKRTSLMHKGGYLGHRRWLPMNHKWRNDANSFDGKIEKGVAPVPLSGDDVLQHYSRFSQAKYGKIVGKKRKRDASNSLFGWKKKSIFFTLPYWRKLKIRHNLDVMHIEKNISDNILGTLMSIQGKNKDTLKSRLDLVKMKIRDKLNPKVVDGKVRVPIAIYTLRSDAKVAICRMFAKMKSPDGYLSNISRCVKDNGKKISCLKSHDHHVFIE
ncbi:uncharacterized protein LOC130826536 [Amaranthus tricolor]|uniref:uncharacterized protein LOC130826536 n=1 Tax=Amaranthus tricolor TaxID=29722 RepID=UPI002590C5C1|nr:uncharacterized protein LOC130826536 [Amaranthus tricolor]